MKLPITIDPRYHDAVLFDLDGALTSDAPLFGATVDLARKLQGIGVAAAAYSSSPQCRQALKSAGIDDLFGVCIDGIAGERGTAENPDPAVLLEADPPTRCATTALCRHRELRRRRGGGPRRRVRARHRHRRDRTCRDLARHGADVVLADLADVAVRTGDKRISRTPECADVLRSADRHHQRTGVDVVPGLRRNAVPHRLGSRCGQARRRCRRGAGTRRRGVPGGHPERSRPRGCPQTGSAYPASGTQAATASS